MDKLMGSVLGVKVSGAVSLNQHTRAALMHGDMWHIGTQRLRSSCAQNSGAQQQAQTTRLRFPRRSNRGDSHRSSYINFNIIDLLPKTLLLKTVF